MSSDFSNPPPYWQPRQDLPPEDRPPSGHEGPPKWRSGPYQPRKHYTFDDAQAGYPPNFPSRKSYYPYHPPGDKYHARSYNDEQDGPPPQVRCSWAPHPDYYRNEEYAHVPQRTYSEHVPAHDIHHSNPSRPPRGSYPHQHRGSRGFRGGGYASHTSTRPGPGPASNPRQGGVENSGSLNSRAPDFVPTRRDLNTYMPKASSPKAPPSGDPGQGRIPDVDAASAAARLARWEARKPDEWLVEARIAGDSGNKTTKVGAQDAESIATFCAQGPLPGDVATKIPSPPDPTQCEGAQCEGGPTGTDRIAAENTPSVPPSLPARDEAGTSAGRNFPNRDSPHIEPLLPGPDISKEALVRPAAHSSDGETPVRTAPPSPHSTTVPSRSYSPSCNSTPPFFRSAAGSVCGSASDGGISTETEVEPAMAWRRGGGPLVQRLSEAKLDRLAARIAALSAELEVLRLEMAQLKTEQYYEDEGRLALADS
ncbi:hypothetical protein C8Q79DRAFT_927426 [Trametes meyenii]|nr:hypothetical protein C8Q79DRAFT_927426 [Trametes meyenii]